MPATFTPAQEVEIRRFCGYQTRANGVVVFPAPWVNVQYLALEYRIQTLTAEEHDVVVKYLTQLAALEDAIPAAGDNLDTDQAAVWTRNRSEVRDRMSLFDNWRRRLCAFLGIRPGPDFVTGPGNTVAMVV